MGSGRPSAASTGAPREVAVPDEPLTAALDRAARHMAGPGGARVLRRRDEYRELGDAGARAAEGLRPRRRPGDRVALVLPNCPEHVIAFYAVLRLGAVVVEHNPLYTPRELRPVRGPGARSRWSGRRPSPACSPRCRRPRSARRRGRPDARPAPLGKRLALRLPCPAAREARAKRCAARAAGDPIGPARRAPAPLAPTTRPGPRRHRAAAVHERHHGHAEGRDAHAPQPRRQRRAGPRLAGPARDRDRLRGAAVLPRLGLTLCLTSRSARRHARALPDLRPRPGARRAETPAAPSCRPCRRSRPARGRRSRRSRPRGFRFAISGAMALPVATATPWEHATGGLVVEGYGMTERSPVALGNPLDPSPPARHARRAVPEHEHPRGRPDGPHRDVAPASAGELLIQGPQVFAGYWSRPDETAEQLLEDGWLRTGDIVTVDETAWSCWSTASRRSSSPAASRCTRRRSRTSCARAGRGRRRGRRRARAGTRRERRRRGGARAGGDGVELEAVRAGARRTWPGTRCRGGCGGRRRCRARDRQGAAPRGARVGPRGLSPAHQPRARHCARWGRSAPRVVPSPWPGWTTVSSANLSNSRRDDVVVEA